MKMAVFWDVAPCSLVEITAVSEMLAAIIALMMETASTSETSVNFYTAQHPRRQPSEDGQHA
jgi:hypothetical protein